jgi:phage gp29-like protein
MSSALAQLDIGRYEWFADAAANLSTDPVLTRAYFIRRAAVAGRAYTVNAPATVAPDLKEEAERLVTLVKRWLDGMDSVESFLMRVLDSIGMGISAHELVWSLKDDNWLPTPWPIMTRELKYNRDWQVEARNASYEWINTTEFPGGYLIHNIATENFRPIDSGCFRSALWYAIFKKAGIQFWVSCAERFGSPLALAHMAPGTDRNQRDQALQDLLDMTNDMVGVVTGASTVEIMDSAAGASSTVYKDLVAKLDEQIFLAMGVSPDLLIAGPNGSRAATETRDSLRLESTAQDAKLMWSSITRDCVSWIRHYNGFSPDCPLPVIESIFEHAVEVSDSVIKSGCATRNEVRKAAGLPAWTSLQGGEEIATLENVTVKTDPLNPEPVKSVAQAPTAVAPAPTASSAAPEDSNPALTPDNVLNS